MRRCLECGEVKELSEFPLANKVRGFTCKACRARFGDQFKAGEQAWRDEFRERMRKIKEEQDRWRRR